MMWHDKDRIQKQGGSVWGRYKGSSEFTSMPFAFQHVAAGSGKVVFPLLSGLFFCDFSLCLPLICRKFCVCHSWVQAWMILMWTSIKFISDTGSKCTAEHATKSESKPKNLLITKMYLFVLYEAKSQLKLGYPWGWNATRKELSTIVVIEKRRLGMPTTNGMKNQIKEHAGYCCDRESRQRCRNQKLQLRNKQSFKGQIGQPLYFGLSDQFPVSEISLGKERFWPICVHGCVHVFHRTAAQTTLRIFSILRQQSNQVSQNQISTFLRGVKYVLTESHSLLVTHWYMKAIASVCV